MPAEVMTFDSLVDDISSYLERTDQETLKKIPTFIMLAEQVIATDLKFLGNLTVAESNLVQNEPVIQKPARWKKTVSLNVTVNGEKQPVFLRKYEYLREYWPNATNTDVPRFYCDYDYDHWLIAPTPAEDFAYEVLYYQRVQPLDSSNQTNWFTQNAPQAILYGTLLQAMPFLKNDERIPMWQGQYTQVIEMLKIEDISRIGDRQTVVRDA